ncbi:hypothetical protein K1719_021741 [Acacia pycnantha]|nr:hypothetical protein K1719_021741 [Acacia pycnantha]
MGKRIGKQTLFWKDVWTKLNTPLLEVLVVISTQFGSKFKEQKFWRMKISAFNILCKFFIYEYAKGSQSAGLVVFQRVSLAISVRLLLYEWANFHEKLKDLKHYYPEDVDEGELTRQWASCRGQTLYRNAIFGGYRTVDFSENQRNSSGHTRRVIRKVNGD